MNISPVEAALHLQDIQSFGDAPAHCRLVVSLRTLDFYASPHVQSLRWDGLITLYWQYPLGTLLNPAQALRGAVFCSGGRGCTVGPEIQVLRAILGAVQIGVYSPTLGFLGPAVEANFVNRLVAFDADGAPSLLLSFISSIGYPSGRVSRLSTRESASFLFVLSAREV